MPLLTAWHYHLRAVGNIPRLSMILALRSQWIAAGCLAVSALRRAAKPWVVACYSIAYNWICASHALVHGKNLFFATDEDTYIEKMMGEDSLATNDDSPNLHIHGNNMTWAGSCLWSSKYHVIVHKSAHETLQAACRRFWESQISKMSICQMS